MDLDEQLEDESGSKEDIQFPLKKKASDGIISPFFIKSWIYYIIQSSWGL